jgi:hypothetical protein
VPSGGKKGSANFTKIINLSFWSGHPETNIKIDLLPVRLNFSTSDCFFVNKISGWTRFIGIC